jgi:hypothetical protein
MTLSSACRTGWGQAAERGGEAFPAMIADPREPSGGWFVRDRICALIIRFRRSARTSQNRRKNVKALMIAAVAAGCLTLAACGGKGDDALGEQAQENMENKADAMDAAADNMSGPAADQLEAQADATREAGEAKEEAIDDADLNADAMTPAEKNAVVAQ